MQAQTIRRRFHEAVRIWAALEDALREHELPDRTADELYDAVIGFRIRRSTYVKRCGVEQRTASRDLARLTDLGLLRPVGETRGRHYVAGPQLRRIRESAVSSRTPLVDPYPQLRAELGQLRT